MDAQTDNEDWLYHPETLEGPVLFSYRPKTFFGRHKKVVVRVGDGAASDAFSLHAAGSSGKVSCRCGDDVVYELGVRVQLSSGGLTKMVVFTPYVIVNNTAPYAVRVRQAGDDDADADGGRWLDVGPSQSAPFWRRPSQPWIVFGDQDGHETVPMSLDKPTPTLLRLDGPRAGLFVDFQVGSQKKKKQTKNQVDFRFQAVQECFYFD